MKKIFKKVFILIIGLVLFITPNAMAKSWPLPVDAGKYKFDVEGFKVRISTMEVDENDVPEFSPVKEFALPVDVDKLKFTGKEIQEAEQTLTAIEFDLGLTKQQIQDCIMENFTEIKDGIPYYVELIVDYTMKEYPDTKYVSRANFIDAASMKEGKLPLIDITKKNSFLLNSTLLTKSAENVQFSLLEDLSNMELEDLSSSAFGFEVIVFSDTEVSVSENELSEGDLLLFTSIKGLVELFSEEIAEDVPIKAEVPKQVVEVKDTSLSIANGVYVAGAILVLLGVLAIGTGLFGKKHSN